MEVAEAIEALRRVGDVEAAAEAGVLAAHGAWRGGRTPEAQERLRAARGLLDGRPPSRALAAVLAEMARVDLFAGRRSDSLEASTAALRLAEQLGLDGMRANVLTTLGVAEFMDGDVDAANGLFEQAVEVGWEASPSEAARALTNLSVVADAAGDREGLEEWTRRAVEYATRLGDRTILLWLEGAEMRATHDSGRWDETLTVCDAFLDETATLGGHYLDRFALELRGSVLAARGDVAGAARDLERSLDGIEAVTDVQSVVPSYVGAATICVLLGDVRRAAGLLERALPIARRSPHRAPTITGEAATTIAYAGRGAEWLAHFETLAPTRRVEAARLVFAGRTVEAAEAYARFAGPAEEAPVRLLAARQLAEAGRRAEADVQLRRALAFYRAVGATHIVREAEALLAQPA